MLRPEYRIIVAAVIALSVSACSRSPKAVEADVDQELAAVVASLPIDKLSKTGPIASAPEAERRRQLLSETTALLHEPLPAAMPPFVTVDWRTADAEALNEQAIRISGKITDFRYPIDPVTKSLGREWGGKKEKISEIRLRLLNGLLAVHATKLEAWDKRPQL